MAFKFSGRFGKSEPVKTITFGKHVGKPRCCASVRDRGSTWPSYHQCDKVAKVTDANGDQWCGARDPVAVDAKNKARNERFDREWDIKTRKWKRDEAFKPAKEKIIEAMKMIRDGHNNPRELAEEVLKALQDAEDMEIYVPLQKDS